jgi:hypothetical protein
LVLGSENNVFGAAFSSNMGTNPEQSSGEPCLSDTRRNCLTVEGLLPNVRSSPNGCLNPLERRLAFGLLTEGEGSFDSGVCRTVEFAAGF